MTAKQISEYTAYTTFLLLVAAEESIAKSLPAFFRYSQTLKDWMAEANGHKAAAQQSTTGITADKNKVKALLLEEMSLLTSLAVPFASENNNTVLFNRIHAFPSTFARTRQHEVATLCQDVLDKITLYLGELADYGITEAMIQENQDLINSFNGKVPTTRSLIKEGTVNTENRDELFDKMSDLVSKKILLSAKGFMKNNNTAFYKKVVAALAVDVTQAATTTLRIKLKYTTVRHATMRFAAHVEGSDVQSTANEKGIITMKFDKGGRHDIEIPIEGGEPVKLTGILLVKGRSKTMTIEL